MMRHTAASLYGHFEENDEEDGKHKDEEMRNRQTTSKVMK